MDTQGPCDMHFTLSSRLFPLLLLFFTACGTGSEKSGNEDPSKEAAPEKVHLSGKVENPKDSTLLVRFKPFRGLKLRSVRLDSSGRFEMELPFSLPTYFSVVHGDNGVRLFARPGDSLRLTVDAGSFDKTLSMQGNGASRARALEKRQELEDSLLTNVKKIYAAGPELFQEKMDSVFQPLETRLDSLKEGSGIDSTFLAYEERRLSMIRDQWRLRYPHYHRFFSEDSVDLSPSFYETLSPSLMENPKNRSIPAFYSFTKQQLQHRREKKIEADSSLADTTSFVHRYQLFKEQVPNDTLRGAFLGYSLYRQLLMEGPDNTRALMKEIKEYPVDWGIKDSLKKMKTRWKRIAEGKKAPGFSYPTIEGDTVSLDSLQGNYVYIDAWATWCGPCKREIPHLKKLEKQFEDRPVSFVSISLDPKSNKGRWKKMVRKKELGGHQLFAKGNAFESKLAKDYIINSIPRFILIGPNGRIIDNNAERPSGNAKEQLKKAMKGQPRS